MKYQKLKGWCAICLSMVLCFSNFSVHTMGLQQVKAQENINLSKGAQTKDIEFLNKCNNDDLINRTVTESQAQEMLDVVNEVIAGAKDDYEKAKLLHAWVFDKIEYESNPYVQISSEPYQVFADKRGVCGGFANLYKEMANLAGLPAVVVNGYYMGNGYEQAHAWNAVYADGKWVYADGTGDWTFDHSDMLNSHRVTEVTNTSIISDGLILGYYHGLAVLGTQDGNPVVEIPDSYEGMPITSISYQLFRSEYGVETLKIGANINQIEESTLKTSETIKEIIVSENNTSYASKEGALFTEDYRALIYYPMASTQETFTLPAQTTSFDIKEAFCNPNLKELLVEEGNTSYASYDGALYDANLTELLFVPLGKTTVTVPANATVSGTAFANVDSSQITQITIYGVKGSPAEEYANMNGMKFMEFCEHELQLVAKKEADCMTAGNQAYYICKECEHVYKDAEGKEETTLEAERIPSTGHSMGVWKFDTDPTCTEKGREIRKCKRTGCDYTEDRAVQQTGHKWETDFTVDKKESCVEEGSKSKHCTKCDAVTEVTAIPKAEHKYGEWKETEAPACTKAGTESRSCQNKNCSQKESRNIPAAGHIWANDFTVDKAASCTEEGSKSKHCTKCDAATEVTAIPMVEHSYDEGKITTQPTTTKEGVKTYTCSVCAGTRTEEIAVLADTTKPSDNKDKEPVALKKGTTRKFNGNTYKVTKSSIKNGTVAFVKAKANAKTVSIPKTIKLNGITYKVTSIEKNAFKNQKKVTKITIGSNVTKLGATMFTNCKKLKTLIIQSAKLTKNNIAKNAFKGLGKTTRIKVAKNKIKTYKTIFRSRGLSAKVKVTN